MEKRPIVVMGLIIRKDGKILLGKRKKYPLAWGLPGGKLDFGEDIKEGIKREVREEVGLKVKNIEFTAVTNDIMEKINEHFVTIILTSDYDSGEVVLKEPDKCEKWDWFDWNNLPYPLSSPVLRLKEQGFFSKGL